MLKRVPTPYQNHQSDHINTNRQQSSSSQYEDSSVQIQQQSYNSKQEKLTHQYKLSSPFNYEYSQTRRIKPMQQSSNITNTKLKNQQPTKTTCPYEKLELESYQIEGQSKSDSFDFNKYMNIIGETAKENNFAKQRTGHLVSFGNISNNLSQQNSNHSSNHSINKRQNQSNQIYENPKIILTDKQNKEPNQLTPPGFYKSGANSSQNKFGSDNSSQQSTNNIKNISIHSKKTHNSNELLLPIVNTSKGSQFNRGTKSYLNSQINYHSNALSQQSSISPMCDSSRVSQDNQVGYLKQKLIQTHQKLIKELQISKQLQDNFFELKNKYQDSLNSIKKYKQAQKLNESQTKQKLSEANQKNQQMNAQISTLKNQITLLNQKITVLQQQLHQQQRQNQIRSKTNKYSSTELKQHLDQEIQLYHQELSRQKQRSNSLKNDLQSMRNKVLELITQNQKQQENLIQQHQLVIQQYQQTMNQKQESLKECQLSILSSEKIKTQLQLQVSNLEGKLSKLDKDFIQKEELCEIWRKKYSDGQQQSQTLQQSIFKHQQEQLQLKNMSTEINIALKQEKQKNAQMLSQIISIQMQNKQLKSKISSIQSLNKELQDKLFLCTPQKNIIQQKQELQHQLQKLTNEYNALSAIINKKDRQISQLNAQLLDKNNQINKFMAKEKQQIHLQQNKAIRMNSVKQFVNQLEQDNQRSISMKKASQQVVRQNVLNKSSPKAQNASFSPISNGLRRQTVDRVTQGKNIFQADNARNWNHNQIYADQQQQNYGNGDVSPSRSLSAIRVKTPISKSPLYDENVQCNQNLPYKGNNQTRTPKSIVNKKILIQEDYEPGFTNKNCDEIEEQIQYKNVRNNSQTPFTLHQQYQSYEDSLQFQSHSVNLLNKNTANSKSSSNLQAKPTGKANDLAKSSQMKPKQRNLTSYKQEKQQYMSLLQQIGELQVQSYNLGQQKKKIVDEIDKIEHTKTKTKEMIAKRRQLQLWLLGNQKKNNQIKEKLKQIRGQVI